MRIVTRLSQFDFRSKLKTWAYRVAVNYILDLKKTAAERMQLNFEQFGEELTSGINIQAPPEAEKSTLIEEVKVGCTTAMLQCLDRAHRLAYILGEIFELPGPDAAEALDVSPDLFRRRLQFARSAVLNFTKRHCGLVSDTAPCRCNRQLPAPTPRKITRRCSHATRLVCSSSSVPRFPLCIRPRKDLYWTIEVPFSGLEPSSVNSGRMRRKKARRCPTQPPWKRWLR